MRAGSRFRRCWFFAFEMPFSRLRHAFAMPSDRLRGRSCKALGLSNLRSDSPLDCAHLGGSYLDPIGASNSSSTLGSSGVSNVVRANSVRGLLFHTGSGEAPVSVAHCCLERSDHQLKTNVTCSTSNRGYCCA